MEVVWLSLVVVFIIIEAITINLVTIWFAAASLCSLFVSYFTDNLFIQLLVFSLVSIFTLIFTKPILDKIFKTDKKEKTNADAVIGKTGIVTDEITDLTNGRVKVSSKSWMATSDENLSKGTKVEVLDIIGAKLVVKKKEEK